MLRERLSHDVLFFDYPGGVVLMSENPILLRKQVIDMYDYSKSREAVLDILAESQRLKYAFMDITPPQITNNYEFNFNGKVPSDIVGDFVAWKIDTEEKAKYLYSRISKVINVLTEEERIFFISNLLNDNSEEFVCEKLMICYRQFTKIKRSAIIKFALAFNVAVLKE